ncbi:hypothetical protein F0919_02335 [Taibaiella lutea]|uniref:DoxX family protein n=1 Tax=Taibaiella lutea TaxID=2608001 RepID=A0A5M6CNE1_9BACT|nr:hypothetical protein [Taibaiella lutea]KAA5536526.1 hypothetical protein F0919_02335 [Taibaiella lutea]
MEKELELSQEQNLLKRYFKQMPVFFPLIGLFLLVMAGIEFWNYAGDGGYLPVYWLRPILFLVYALLWIPICFGKKWAALGFLILSILGMAFFLFGPDITLKHAIGDVYIMPIPANILFSFLILFFYRKLK